MNGLTDTEGLLLGVLLQGPATRDELTAAVDSYMEGSALRQHIARMRRKLAADGLSIQYRARSYEIVRLIARAEDR